MLAIDRVSVRFGGIVALDEASLTVERGRICGLIGPNGAGKTTLFNCITRLCTPDGGTVTYDGRDITAVDPHDVIRLGIARTFQDLGLFASMSVRDNVLVGAHHRTRASFASAPLRLSGVRAEEAGVTDEVDDLLVRLGLAEVADRRVRDLPLGTLKRVELSRALASRPDLLLLDEPANGLNHGEVAELEQLIRRTRTEHDLTMLVVEHHMTFVMSISDTVVCLNSFMEAARSLDDVQADMFLPGVSMTTDGADDGFPLEAMAVGVLEGDQWVMEGDVVDTREVFGPVSEATE